MEVSAAQPTHGRTQCHPNTLFSTVPGKTLAGGHGHPLLCGETRPRDPQWQDSSPVLVPPRAPTGIALWQRHRNTLPKKNPKPYGTSIFLFLGLGERNGTARRGGQRPGKLRGFRPAPPLRRGLSPQVSRLSPGGSRVRGRRGFHRRRPRRLP